MGQERSPPSSSSISGWGLPKPSRRAALEQVFGRQLQAETGKEAVAWLTAMARRSRCCRNSRDRHSNWPSKAERLGGENLGVGVEATAIPAAARAVITLKVLAGRKGPQHRFSMGASGLLSSFTRAVVGPLENMLGSKFGATGHPGQDGSGLGIHRHDRPFFSPPSGLLRRRRCSSRSRVRLENLPIGPALVASQPAHLPLRIHLQLPDRPLTTQVGLEHPLPGAGPMRS